MSTQFTVKVNGVDITSYVDKDTMWGRNSLTERLDTCQFVIVDPAARLTVTGKQDILITDQHGTAWFGGVVAQVTRMSDTNVRVWQVDGQGYGHLLDTAIVNKVYTNVSDLSIISDILATARPEITFPNIEATTPTTVDHIVLPYQFASHAIEKVCKVVGTKYYIDPLKKVHYFHPAQLTPVAAFTASNPDNVTGYSFRNWQMIEDATQVQNRAMVIGSTYLAPPITDSFTGTGAQTTFQISYRPHSVTSCTVGGVARTIGHFGTDDYGGPTNITALVDDYDQSLIFQTAPGNGVSVQITYTYMKPIVVRVPRTQSYTVFGRYYDGKVKDTSILSAQTASERANTVLDQYAYSQFHGQFGSVTAPYIRSGNAVLVTNKTDAISGAQFLVQTNQWQALGNGVVLQQFEVIG